MEYIIWEIKKMSCIQINDYMNALRSGGWARRLTFPIKLDLRKLFK